MRRRERSKGALVPEPPLAMNLPSGALLVLVPLVSPQEADHVQAWCEDAAFVVAELERLHPRPFFAVPRVDVVAALERFETGVEGWDDERAAAELVRLVALVSRTGMDGHTAAWPMPAEYLPVQLHSFSDGWFVVGASKEHADLVGARVVALGGVPVEDASARLAPFVSRDNDWSLRARMALALTATSLLRAAGIGEGGPVAVELVLRDGQHAARSLQGVRGPEDLRPWGGRFARSLPAVGGARWLEGRERPFRAEVLAAERALYVQYNAVVPRDESGKTIADFAAELVRTFEERGLERLVLDLRSNAGGDSTTFPPLIQALKGHPSIDRRGALYALVGRATFSAGGNFVCALRDATSVILVGEPLGGAPDHFGDAEELALPHHRGLFVRVSTLEHRHARPGEDPRVLSPDLPAELSSADYFAGRDPVLARALEHREAR